MTLENYSRFRTAFEAAFPGAKPPTWRDLDCQHLGTMLDAIVRVKLHHLTKFHADKAGLVIRSAAPQKMPGHTSKRQRPCYKATK